MSKRVIFSLVLFAGLLAGLVLLSGCIPTATGQAPTGTGGFDWTFLIFIAIIVVVFYFLMIRPQRNRQNQQRKLLNELKAGDRVVTVGGMYGEIESVDEVSVVLKVESGATIRFARQSIAGLCAVDS